MAGNKTGEKMKKESIGKREKKKTDKKQKIIKALMAESEKDADKINVKRIEKKVRLLEEIEGKIEDDRDYDYDNFLWHFNLKNGMALQRCCKTRKQDKLRYFRRRRYSGRKKYFILWTCCRTAMVLVFAMILFSTEIVTKAASEQSVVSWLTSGCREVIFGAQDTVYAEWNDGAEVNDCIEARGFICMNTGGKLIYREIKLMQLGIMVPSYLPEGFDFFYAFSSKYENIYQVINLVYRNEDNCNISIRILPIESGYINRIEKPRADSIYLETLNINGYQSYIFIGERSESFFCIDGMIYWIYADIDADELCKVIENMKYVK